MRLLRNISCKQYSLPVELSSLSEEVQIAIAIQRSIQYPEIEDTPSIMPIATATDDDLGSLLSEDSDEVFVTFLCNPPSFSIFKVFDFAIFA